MDSALDIYGKFSEFEDEGVEDLAATLVNVSEEIKKLPQRHANLWDIFKQVKNKKDVEAYESLLGDEEKRERFYERLLNFSKTLGVALSAVSFHENTSKDKIKKYKADLKFFSNLRTSVRRRYSETVDYKEYESKIKKLIDTHVGSGEVEQLTDLVNIFDTEKFSEEVDQLKSTASKADTIAHRTKKTIEDQMEKDPEFYRPFSEMLKRVIEDHRLKRISSAECLKQSRDIEQKIRNRTGDEVPKKLDNHEVAKAFYGAVLKIFKPHFEDESASKDASATVGLKIDEIIKDLKIVNWINNSDVQNKMKGEIEDYLFEVKNEHEFDLTFEDIDKILELCLDIARLRYPG